MPREKAPAPPTFVYELLDGAHDAAIRAYARAVRECGAPVLLRLNNEMNGDWCRYCAYWTSQDPELFRAVWHHVFRTFADEGAANAVWLWNPHDLSFPPFRYNHAALYYPGNEVVDLIGLTGYNTGTYYPNERWRAFDEIYAPLYAEYALMFPRKPFAITEFACSAIGGDKPAWIRDALTRLPRYPRIRLAVWWNWIDRDGDQPARPYRLDGPEELAAFENGIAAYRPVAR
jgi:beta-mannanase